MIIRQPTTMTGHIICEQPSVIFSQLLKLELPATNRFVSVLSDYGVTNP